MNNRSFFISVLTVFIQYYDYHLYGFLAAKIADHFFPADDTIIKLLNTYLIMTVAMMAKPIGAVILGKIGDIKGRSDSFALSLVGTASASFVLFICPSYEEIGYLAVILLLASRMVISACVSSGSDGVRIFIYENIAKDRQCYGIGVTTLFTQAGTLVGSVVAFIVTLDIMPDNAWKFSFLFGSIMASIAIFLMKTSNFQDISKPSERTNFEEFRNIPLRRIIVSNFKLFFTCLALAGAIGSTNQFTIIFFGTYCYKVLNLIDKSTMKTYVIAAIMLYMVFSVIGGILADKFGRFKVAILGLSICIIFTSIQIYVIINDTLSPILYLLMTSSLPLITMPSAAIIKASIPAEVRYRIFSLSHAIGSILISAPTAYISTLLFHKTNIAWMPFLYFIMSLALIFYSLLILNNKKLSSVN
jgi:MFS transporter, MHS family, proline/betaine transporter